MKYYEVTDGRLVQYNPATKVYKIRNTIEHIDTRIPEDVFLTLESKRIKHNEFCRLMNVFYKNVKHSWVYNGVNFRKLDNFESENYKFSSNYNLGKDVPYHDIPIYGKCVLVYHWGRIYYHSVSYGGSSTGQLLDPITKSSVRWCQLKHCAPVFNEETKTIC